MKERTHADRTEALVIGSVTLAAAVFPLLAVVGSGGPQASAESTQHAPLSARATIPEAYKRGSGSHEILMRSEDRPGLDRLLSAVP